MQAGEQPRITKDVRRDRQGDVIAMRAVEANVREAAASERPEVQVSDARGSKLTLHAGLRQPLPARKPRGPRPGQPL
jgi:hypothetical protein